MNVFLTRESHVWKSLIKRGQVHSVWSLVTKLEKKVRIRPSTTATSSRRPTWQKILLKWESFGFEKILQAETYQRYEVWYEVDWRDKVDQAPNVHKGTQSTLSKIHDKQTKLGTYLILYSVQHMPQPPVLIHLEC